jgi:hypothetical protein
MTAGQLLNRIAEMVDEKITAKSEELLVAAGDVMHLAMNQQLAQRDQRIEELTTALTFQAGVVNGIAMVIGYKIGADDEPTEIKPKPKR